MSFHKKIREFIANQKDRKYSKEQFEINQKHRVTCLNLRRSAIPYTTFLLVSFGTVLHHYLNNWKIFHPHSISFFSWLRHEQLLEFLLTFFVRFSIISFIYSFLLYFIELYFNDQIFKYRVLILKESYQDSIALEKSPNPKTIELKLSRIRNLRKSWTIYAIIIILCGTYVYNSQLYELDFSWCFRGEKNLWEVLPAYLADVAVYAVPLSIIYPLVLFLAEVRLDNQLSSLKNIIQNETAMDLLSEDLYKNSIKMSYSYLNQYYDQTRKQAENGFKITCGVAICGAIIIFCGILAMLLGNAEPAYLTTATGIIIEFIASIFFYLYNKTMQNMGDYHNKLVLSQNIAIALEVVADINEGSDNVKSEMVRELLKDINTHINENKPERKSDSIDHTKA